MKRGRPKKTLRTAAEIETALVRFGISIPADLLSKFDQHLSGKTSQNRSEAIRDLIRDRLVDDDVAEGKGEQVVTVTLLYEAQNLDLQRRLAESRKNLVNTLLSFFQVRISERHELALLVLRGPATAIRAQAEGIQDIRGILHGKMVMTSPTAP